MLALTFADKSDYAKVREDDRLSILGLENFKPDVQLRVRLEHADGSTDEIATIHTYNEMQIDWFKAGSALNLMRN